MNINEKIKNQLSANQNLAVKFIANVAEMHSAKAFLVGGVVRDIILNKKIHDIDIAVESDPNLMFESLKNSEQFQIVSMSEFGVVKGVFDDVEIDIAMTRKEAYLSPGALPKVFLKTEIDVDLLRRDFSINALAVSLNSKTWGEVIDVSNSLEDLENGVIKILHPNSFIDDPTRIFRAIKYANRLNMKISKCTYENMYKSIENVNLLSGKRIANEILSIFQEDNFENILNHQIMIMIFEKFEFHLADRNTLQDLENIKNICINDENMWWVFISSHFNYLDREKFSNRLDLKTKNHKAIMDFTTVERMDTNLQKEDIYKYLNMIPKNILEISKKLLEEKSILQIEIFQSILFDLETIIDGKSILELGVNEGPEIGRVLNCLTMKIVNNGAMSIQAQKEFVKSLI
tara:strand:- start:10460 stop:11668 length:1209 start_codon:yes stop_codon:yes gene_type:complete